jgi:hypothetical protein
MVEAAQIMRIRDNLVKMYSMMTGQTQDQIIRTWTETTFECARGRRLWIGGPCPGLQQAARYAVVNTYGFID